MRLALLLFTSLCPLQTSPGLLKSNSWTIYLEVARLRS